MYLLLCTEYVKMRVCGVRPPLGRRRRLPLPACRSPHRHRSLYAAAARYRSSAARVCGCARGIDCYAMLRSMCLKMILSDDLPGFQVVARTPRKTPPRPIRTVRCYKV